MTPRELYEKYKGKRAIRICSYHEILRGIVVGYNSHEFNSNRCLIIALNDTRYHGWRSISPGDHILKMNDNELGFRYVFEKEVIIFKFG